MPKQQAPGICDHCLEPLPAGRWYTTKGKPRGEWQNPTKLWPPTPAEQARHARRGRQRAVAAGTWRNPALSPEAREKLSRPHKHGGNPLLHAVFEKLRGGTTADLTPKEQRAHLEYRATLRDPIDVICRYGRRYTPTSRPADCRPLRCGAAMRCVWQSA